MHVRKFKTPKSELIKEGKKIVSENADNKFVYRVTMVNLILSGISPAQLEQYCGESKRTLMTTKQEGRPRRLNKEQENKIKDALNSESQDYGYNVWDGPSLSDFISKTFNVVLGVRACQLLMHRLGFNLIRPQTYPSLENPQEEAREDFKKKSEE